MLRHSGSRRSVARCTAAETREQGLHQPFRRPFDCLEPPRLVLRATLWGLLIAIPSLITWSYFSKKIEILAVEMETLCDQFLRRQYREGKEVKSIK